MLTQQYEFAKVQEAKETPSVKVLDAANIPEKKSYPPRLVIDAAGGRAGPGVRRGLAMGQHRLAGEADSGHPCESLPGTRFMRD